jgi:hypothetical protein
MEQEQESAFFNLGDKTALVCVDHQQYQKIVVPQLIDLTYKVHLGLFAEDVLLKLKSYNYSVVVIYENFKGSTLQTNPILQELVKQLGVQRRESFVILLSHRYPTNDAMSAWIHSVDHILNIADLGNFKSVLGRGIAEYHDLYQAYQEMAKSVQAL